MITALALAAALAAPGGTPLAPDTATSRTVVDGIPVIVRRVSANDVVTANVYLLGGR